MSRFSGIPLANYQENVPKQTFRELLGKLVVKG